MESRKLNEEERNRAFFALYYWGKIIGIVPVCLLDNNEYQFSYLSLLYGCTLSIMYCYIYSIAALKPVQIFGFGATPVATIIVHIGVMCQVVANTFTCWIYCAVRQTRIIRLVKKFMETENLSRKFGIPDDYDKTVRKFGTWVIFTNVLHLVSLVTSEILLVLYSQSRGASIWMFFNVLRIVSFDMEILFIWCLIIVRSKFRRLNEKLRFCIHVSSSLRKKARSHEHFRSGQMSMVSKLHRELRNLIHLIEEHFTPVVFFIILNDVTCLLSSIYQCYRYIKINGGAMGFEWIMLLFSLHYWIVYPLATLVVVSAVCGSTSDEANNTGNVLHAMQTDFGDNSEAAEVKILSLELLHNRVTIWLCGYFVLDDFFVYRTLSMGAMYFTIMLQFYA